MKATPLLATPFTLATTGPEVADIGTTATTVEALQLEMVAASPLKVIELSCIDPRLVPGDGHA